MPPLHALVLEDDLRARSAVVELMELEKFRVTPCGTLKEVREALEAGTPDCAVLDLDLPDGSGMSLLEELQERDVEILILTGRGSVDSAVEAMRVGVADFLTKPLDVPRLQKAVRDVRRTLLLRQDIAELRREARESGKFAGMVGTSPQIREVFQLIEKAAPTDATVLITGETGTGKELVAAAIHRLSKRASKRFVSVNCGALQPTLIESELFGHEPGAFTGATKRKKGVFEQADGGTLFLDELFEMPVELQVNLLRVLETREVTRVGAEKPTPVDFRLVGATNKDALDATASGEVREDLLYRLMVFPIELPSLRERVDDVPALAQHFLDLLIGLNGDQKSLLPETVEELKKQPWPGNIRELRNSIERAYILSDSEIKPEHLHTRPQGRPAAAPDSGKTSGPGLDVRVGMSVADAERVLIDATLADLDGDKRRAAEVLGISLKTLYNRLKVYAAADGGSGS